MNSFCDEIAIAKWIQLWIYHYLLLSFLKKKSILHLCFAHITFVFTTVLCIYDDKIHVYSNAEHEHDYFRYLVKTKLILYHLKFWDQ